MKHSKRFLEIVKAIKARVRETDVQTVRARQKKGDTFYLVDVREDNEWDKGHLPGAIHLGKGVIERDIEGVIPDVDAEIVLYCGGGYRSVLAAENLARMGYTNVVSMDGGIRGWSEAGFPIEHDD
ncbi:MAG: sulfurtransferase [Candidatus Latescibacteria bacterium]|nr:sulfurtransferase [Candidatus Latescibacterota bacterium]